MEKTVTILNEEGLHARPAGLLVKKASEFAATIELRANGVTKSARSIMGLMSLGLAHGTEVTIVANGTDEAAAIDALAGLVARKFAVDSQAGA